MLLFLHKDVAVESITFKSLFKMSKYVILSYLIAFGSTLDLLNIRHLLSFWQQVLHLPQSHALKAAVVSVVKYGLPVP